MNNKVKTGLSISAFAAVIGGVSNYLYEGKIANALTVAAIGFTIGLVIMLIFILTGKGDE